MSQVQVLLRNAGGMTRHEGISVLVGNSDSLALVQAEAAVLVFDVLQVPPA